LATKGKLLKQWTKQKAEKYENGEVGRSQIMQSQLYRQSKFKGLITRIYRELKNYTLPKSMNQYRNGLLN
jgi:hypothetical protein